MTNFEHAATKAPQVLPKHSCFPEIWQETACWVQPSEKKKVGFGPHYMFETNPEDYAEQLEILYRDQSARSYYGNEVHDLVTQQKYQWKSIEQDWKNLFQRYAMNAKRFHRKSEPQSVVTSSK